MKRALSLCLVLVLLLTLFGCGKKAPEAQKPEEEAKLRRVTSVSIERKGMDPQAYTVAWSDYDCAFTAADPEVDTCVMEATFHTQTKTLALRREGRDLEPQYIFDDVGRVVRVAYSASAQNGTSISYDEQGWPQTEGQWLNLEINKEKMQYSYLHSVGQISLSNGKTLASLENYRTATLNKAGQNTKVDGREVAVYKEDGRKEETTQESVATYTYDAGGNLLRYESGGIVMEFTYGKEEIHHTWERMIPLICCGSILAQVEPLFWNLK